VPAFGEHLKPWYPGLGSVETGIWRDYLVDEEQNYQRFDYNVRVGEGVRPLRGVAPADPEMRARQDAAWKAWTQKRIDAVGFRNDGVVLFEITERANVRSLGQLLTYDNLYAKAFPPNGANALVLLCRRVGADIGDAFDENGVDVVLVPVRRR
jgi:hypothetical protein